jgi:ferredoxin-type protein NapH
MLKITKWRLISQIISFGILVYLGYLGVRMLQWHDTIIALPTLSCHFLEQRVASCYIYAVQEMLGNGWSVKYTSLIIPTIGFLILGVIFGRSWCSWVCPIGFIQDLTTRLRKSLKISHYSLSDKLKQAAVYTKWFLILYLIVVALGIGIPNFFLAAYKYDLLLPFCQICPGKQIFPMLAGRFNAVLKVENMSMLTTIMGYLAIASFIFYVATTAFIRRLWCRICPIAVFLGLLNRFSLLFLKKEGKRCTKCGICLRSCPVQVKEVYEEKEKERIDPSTCILCYRCVEMCPEKDALKVGFLKFSFFPSSYKRFIKSTEVKVRARMIGPRKEVNFLKNPIAVSKEGVLNSTEKVESKQLQKEKSR